MFAQGAEPRQPPPFCDASHRSDMPMLVTGEDEYMLGEASTGDGAEWWSPAFHCLRQD